MAEVVEHRVEEMLPELEQMSRVGLFTKEETGQILTKRKVYEYKLRRKQKKKEDFLHYIQYETNLLALVRKRRERTGYSFKKVEIDNNIVVRIHRLYKLVLYRFPEDVKLWLSYIAFAKQLKAKDLVSRQYTKMLQVHDKKPELWLSAAKWEFEENNNPDNARGLLQRALRFNQTSQTLWQEYYRMELMYAEKMRKRRSVLDLETEGESDPVLSGGVAFIVFQQALEAIPDNAGFVIQFLPICLLFDFTSKQEQDICALLAEKFSDNPLAWDALARRHLARKSTSKNDAREDERKFHEVYGEAIGVVTSGEVWKLYINACLDLIQKAGKQSLQEKRLERALLVFEEARDVGHLTPDLYAKWTDLLQKTGSLTEALEVCCAALEVHPGDITLWEKKLSLMITVGKDLNMIQDTLDGARKNIPKKDSWPLVRMVLEHSIASNAAEDTVKLLEKSMIDPSPVSQPAKELYLEFEYLQHGMQHARKVFSRICEYKPVSEDVYRSYVSMEMAQPKPKMKLVRAAYEEAVREHGALSPNLWLDYIKFESCGLEGRLEAVGNIHFRAVKALDGEHNQDFIRRYTLMQTGCP
ncbi:U3 small nucleolar RNA-associated protein 6 homolog [Mya arenaria]|uniref:U3 small nucleolar RNA-associated protein 6 homolog n=1 Tax=Mya arenaria TaxID=6604 RepID=UPI0022E8B602|nr:U3 small nucleolar RNA-associated protein 6 homolog [Mya arenaria]